MKDTAIEKAVSAALTPEQKRPTLMPLFKQGDLVIPIPVTTPGAAKYPIVYHYGYKFIHPQDKEMEWDYTIQLHKNQNGKHFDLRLARPGENKAYSWAMKKIPLVAVKPVLATRTFDHNLEHMNFEGPLTTARGYGEVKIVQQGKAKVKKIDENGIQFEIDKHDYRLRPFHGKRYLFEQVIF